MVRSAIPIIVVIVATAPFQARQEVPRFSGAWELVPDQSQADGEGASFAVAQSSTAATGLVAGTVLDALSGAAVSGAIVRIHRTEERIDITGATLQAFSSTPLPGASSVTTGKDGRFEFRELPGGAFYVWVQHRQYLPGGYGQRRPDAPRLNLELTPGEKRADVSIYLWKPGRIAGEIHDEDGDAVVGVKVLALRRTFLAGRERFGRANIAETDDRGQYRFTDLTPGDYVIVIPSSTSSIPAKIVEAYAQTADDQAVRLHDELSRSGAPLPTERGVGIGPHVVDWRGPAGQIKGSSSPARPDLSVYPLLFYPSANAPVDAAKLRVEPGADLTSIDFAIRLEDSKSVSGRVTGPDGRGTRVALRLVRTNLDAVTSDRGLETALTISDEDGNFRFVGVPVGDYTVKSLVATGAWDPDPGSVASLLAATPIAPNVLRTRNRPGDEALLWAERRISVGDSDVSGLDVRLRVGVRVQGQLFFEGKAELPTRRQLTNMPIHLDPVDTPREGALAVVRPDESGLFTTAPYAPGRYRVFVGIPNAKWKVKSVVVDGVDVDNSLVNVGNRDVTNVVVTLTDLEHTISGSVQGEKADDVRYARVIAFPADFESWIALGMNPRSAHSTNCNSLGTYTIRNIRPGDTLVAAFSAVERVDIEDPDFIRLAVRRAIRFRVGPGDNRVPVLRLVPAARTPVAQFQKPRVSGN
jgi:hypothetical protein